TSLADLVRAMNCYYSNPIEGHDTHPVDIERALKNDYSNDPRKRDLQLEAKAHITVQKWIDGGGLRGRAVTSEGIREIHRRFLTATDGLLASCRMRCYWKRSIQEPSGRLRAAWHAMSRITRSTLPTATGPGVTILTDAASSVRRRWPNLRDFF